MVNCGLTRNTTVVGLLATLLIFCSPARAGTLTGSFSNITAGANINLTSEGEIDWVHWGLYTETSLDRKAGVVAQISDFVLLDAPFGFSFVYQYADNANGYSWRDGTPTASVTNTTTGVWAYGTPLIDSGFQITAPADTATRVLKVYVGVYGSRGKFEAYLSDRSAAGYTNASSLFNPTSGPGGYYKLTYAAGSTGQQLIIRWTLLSPAAGGAEANVTLQAAALTSSTANNPPYVALTSPANNANFSAGNNLTLAANANDLDGQVTNVEFFANGVKLGGDATYPYAFTWNNVPAGPYVLTARATDDLGADSDSSPVELFVHGSGGSLTGTLTMPPALPSSVNLTGEGPADWAHWGLATNSLFNHKAEVVQQISDFTKIGPAAVQRFGDNYTRFSWSDGTPTTNTAGTTTGIYLTGESNGFEITAPADTNSRTLKVYVGLYGAQGNFQAWLSDFSAPAYTDTTVSNVFANAYGVYALNYAAGSPGQTLHVRYRSLKSFDADFGNVTLQAATLQGGSVVVPPPLASFAGTPTNGLAPLGVTFTDTSTGAGITNRQWDFGDGHTLNTTSTTVPHTYTNAGRYTVTLVVSGESGVRTNTRVNYITALASVVITNARRLGNDFALSFNTQSQFNYTVQYAESLPASTWTNLTPVAGDGSLVTVTNFNAGEGGRYYRVQTH